MLLEVGRVVKPHGLKGEVIVALVTDRTERVAPGTRLSSATGELVVEASRPHQHRWIVQFEGIAGREGAEALRGAVLAAEALEDPDALWVHDLVDCRVIDTEGRHYGYVDAVEANPASDILVLDRGGLVPLTFVVETRLGTVVIDPPEGLVEPWERHIEIVDYDPDWPSRFEAEAAAIRDALGTTAVRVDHVGSTSVPGLAAKPVVDIQLSVASVASVESYRAPLQSLGYRFVPDAAMPDYPFFRKPRSGPAVVHVHVCEAASEEERTCNPSKASGFSRCRPTGFGPSCATPHSWRSAFPMRRRTTGRRSERTDVTVNLFTGPRPRREEDLHRATVGAGR